MVLMLVLHINEENRCVPAPRKLILQQAPIEESQCNQQLADGIFVQANGTLNQLLGGENPLSPSPSESTDQPPGLPQAAPPPHSWCTSPPLDRQVLTPSRRALTQWTHLFPLNLSFDFQPQPTTWARVRQELLPWRMDPRSLPDGLGSTHAHADKTNNAWSTNE